MQRKRGTEAGREGERETKKDRGSDRGRVRVCMCVHVHHYQHVCVSSNMCVHLHTLVSFSLSLPLYTSIPCNMCVYKTTLSLNVYIELRRLPCIKSNIVATQALNMCVYVGFHTCTQSYIGCHVYRPTQALRRLSTCVDIKLHMLSYVYTELRKPPCIKSYIGSQHVCIQSFVGSHMCTQSYIGCHVHRATQALRRLSTCVYIELHMLSCPQSYLGATQALKCVDIKLRRLSLCIQSYIGSHVRRDTQALRRFFTCAYMKLRRLSCVYIQLHRFSCLQSYIGSQHACIQSYIGSQCWRLLHVCVCVCVCVVVLVCICVRVCVCVSV